MKVGIIGAGPAGITAAYLLSKKNVEVELYEAGSQCGGLSRTISLWDQKVDLGPHRFFSNDKRVNDLWLEVVGNDYGKVTRNTRIYYDGKFYYYPLRALNVLMNLGPAEALNCLLSYIKEKIVPTSTDDGSFESWVKSRFGKRLFEIFFKSYSEKLWGIKCTELDADFAGQRIKQLSLWEIIKNIFSSEKKKHKSLIDEFSYPNEGTGMVYERMEAFIRKSGNHVFLNTPVKRVITEGKAAKAIELMTGEIREYDHIISTMPLSIMVSHLPQVPPLIKQFAENLRFRNTILVYLHIDSDHLFTDNWLYIHSADLKLGRVTNFRNWVPQLYGDKKTTVLALEYWCFPEDAFWQMDDQSLTELGKKEILKTGLIGNAAILDSFIFRIPKCYPLYKRGYMNELKPVQQYLKSFKNLSAIGRYGAFKYNNQDHSILMAILAVENIVGGKQHDLWEINTDYDNYQEE
jgi:protoporphyrinogen oxidase